MATVLRIILSSQEISTTSYERSSTASQISINILSATISDSNAVGTGKEMRALLEDAKIHSKNMCY